MRRLTRLLPVFATLIAGSALAAPEQPLAPAPPITPQIIHTQTDDTMRLTVPVTVDGHGPYHFIVDTGADRTVVSRALADELRLPPGNSARMIVMSGMTSVDTVRIGALDIAGKRTEGIHAPALDAANLGAQGLLGLDSLKDRRIIMDFRAGTLTIAEPGAREPYDPDMIVVTAKSRYGQLVLVDADIDGNPITVIIDSGAQNTIGNSALRSLLERRNRRFSTTAIEMTDVIGRTVKGDIGQVDNVRMGGIRMNSLWITFADVHPFKTFGLEGRPAMLLGMSALRAFRRVSVDFAARKVRFLMPKDIAL